MLTAIGMTVIGTILLVLGGEFLVRGASRLALAARLSSLFIGLTIVAFGTSMPELLVSLTTALEGEANLALGNVVGSNIFNVLFILGASALAAPLIVKPQIVRRDGPLMIGFSVLLVLFALDNQLARWEGATFVLLLLAYTGWSYYTGKQELEKHPEAMQTPEAEIPKISAGLIFGQIALIVAGIMLLMWGCDLFVGGAVKIAELLGVSKAIIGLTVLAVGTSLPELVTSVIASLKGERDIAIGNVVGSNVFNITSVLGISAAVSGTGLTVPQEFLTSSIPVMLASSFLCLPIFYTGMIISRWEGALFLGLYIAYTTYLILQETHPEFGVAFGNGLLFYAFPPLALGIAWSVLHSWRSSLPTSAQAD